MRNMFGEYSLIPISGDKRGYELDDYDIGVQIGYVALVLTSRPEDNGILVTQVYPEADRVSSGLIESGATLRLGRQGLRLLRGEAEFREAGVLDSWAAIERTIRGDEYISGAHAEISAITPTIVVVSDLKSMNSTHVAWRMPKTAE